MFDRRQFLLAGLIVTGKLAIGIQPVCAQVTNGFDIKIDSAVTGKELSAQPNLWAFEVRLKTMRMITVELSDPKTKTK